MLRYRIPGTRISNQVREADSYLDIVNATTAIATRLEGGRGADEDSSTAAVDPADQQVVKIVLDGNVAIWTSVQDAREDFGVAAGQRGGAPSDLIPPTISLGHAERGGGLLVKALEVLNVRFGNDLEDAAASKIAEKLEEAFEKKVRKGGLYKLDERGALIGAGLPKKPTEPFLVFVHGTASSTEGGFGELFLRSEWAKLREHYKGNILAFEHRTLSVSPVQNALDLVTALPGGATIDFISHSRGGLVCELICRAMRMDENGKPLAPFDKTDEEIIRKTRSSSTAGDLSKLAGDEIALLKKLGTVLANKKLNVRRFVRVACPARGTSLASRRLDRYLSIIVNLIRLTPGLAANPIYDLTMGVLLAVAKKRTDPREIPGLEAQMPESPLIAMLNRQDVQLSGGLSVVAGDVEGTGILGRLKVLAADIFYLEDHDLVVNTKAMYGGARRVPEAGFLLDRGGEVNHFSYFMNERTAQALLDSLRSSVKPDSVSGFAAIAGRGAVLPSARGPAGAKKAAPTVFVLPGTMGSQIQVETNQVWFDAPEIAFGGIKKIRWGQPKISPDGVFARYYGGLVDFLAASHNAVPFDYDWRRSMLDEGSRLAAAARKALTDNREGVRFIAHSMGGLVVRAMAVQDPGLWADLQKHPAFRLVMLGTPNLGSFSIVSTLMGRDSTIRQLALLDLKHSAEDLLDFISAYPGVLELLPRNQAGLFYTPEMWKKLLKADKGKWPLPSAAALVAAANTWAKLEGFSFPGKGVAYVAGHDSDPTPAGVKFAEDGKSVSIVGTARGDGRVPWATGIPQGVPAWYVDCAHGDLPRYEKAFAAYLDLLNSGTTTRIGDKPRGDGRGAEDAEIEIKPPPVEIYPDTEDVLDAIVGAKPAPRPGPAKPKTTISICHGDLKFCSGFVIAGHYEGDILTGPEAEIDRMFNGKLSAMRALGIYPGTLRSAEVIGDSGQKLSGAVLVGLGNYGELDPGDLMATYSYALRKAAFASRTMGSFPGSDAPSYNTLIIGSRESKLSVRDSILAMLEGLVQANDAFDDESYRIRSLRILELFEDRAIEVLHILRDLKESERFSESLEFSLDLEKTRGALRRIGSNPESGTWRKLLIKSNRDEPFGTSLTFTDVSAGARAVKVALGSQASFVQPFLASTSGQTATNAEAGKVLFELLVPAEFKAYAGEKRPIILTVDKDSAQYPWELLHDKSSAIPMAVANSCIRQLEDATMSYNPIQSDNKKAIVIGDSLSDPAAGFVELKGAQEEAREVSRILEDGGFDAKPLIREQPYRIAEALFTTGARILHIATHGVFGYGPEKLSGAVIGPNMFFTAQEAKQLAPFPEIVFLNCCHLGNMAETDDRQRAIWNDRHRLAANLAKQFIQSGARVVVAAGWAVNDKAAEEFAVEFYRSMIAGSTFSDAVWNGRRLIYNTHKTFNTWGAYQCYGDPDYRLPDRNRSTSRRSRAFGTIQEARLEVENCAAANDTASLGSLGKSIKRIEAVIERIPEKWRKDPEIQEGLGRAYGDVLKLDEALACYETAAASADGIASLRATEQLADLRAKNAIRRSRMSPGAPGFLSPAEARREVNASIKQISGLMTMLSVSSEPGAPAGRTAQRLAILGRCHLRLAMLAAEEPRSTALAAASACFKEAYDLSRKSKRAGSGYYPAVNWQLAEVLGGGGPDDALLKSVADDARAEEARDPDFAALPSAVDSRIIRFVADGLGQKTSGKAGRSVDSILDAFRLAWRRGSSYRDGQSIVEQLEFIAEMLKDSHAALATKVADLGKSIGAEINRAG